MICFPGTSFYVGLLQLTHSNWCRNTVLLLNCTVAQLLETQLCRENSSDISSSSAFTGAAAAIETEAVFGHLQQVMSCWNSAAAAPSIFLTVLQSQQ